MGVTWVTGDLRDHRVPTGEIGGSELETTGLGKQRDWGTLCPGCED